MHSTGTDTKAKSYFIRRGCDGSKSRQISLHAALHLSHVAEGFGFSSTDLDKRHGGNTVLHKAVQGVYGYTELIEWALDRGADIEVRENTFESTPLILAAQEGLPRVVRLQRYQCQVQQAHVYALPLL